MTTAKKLCLAIVKYFFDFGNKRFFLLVPSPPIKVIAFLKHRNNVSSSLKIKKKKLKPKFKKIRKVFPFRKIDFFAVERSRDLICMFSTYQIDNN